VKNFTLLAFVMQCGQRGASEKIIVLTNIHAVQMTFFCFSLDIFSQLICDGVVPAFARRPGSSPFRHRSCEL
jgi:hypothetical protein